MTTPALRVPAFVVLSGGQIGALAVRQILRAVAAGRLTTDRVVVVDRNPECEARRIRDPRVELAVADWGEWLEAGLDGLGGGAHLVPYHWAPHVLVDWLARQIAGAGGQSVRGGDMPAFDTPVDRATRDGDRALSYATWLCPPTCIEPALCPHTRGAKDWSLAGDLHRTDEADRFLGRIVFRCLHLVWGVGTIPVDDILAARDRLLSASAAGRSGPYLVATSSHCHALATVLETKPPVAPPALVR